MHCALIKRKNTLIDTVNTILDQQRCNAFMRKAETAVKV